MFVSPMPVTIDANLRMPKIRLRTETTPASKVAHSSAPGCNLRAGCGEPVVSTVDDLDGQPAAAIKASHTSPGEDRARQHRLLVEISSPASAPKNALLSAASWR